MHIVIVDVTANLDQIGMRKEYSSKQIPVWSLIPHFHVSSGAK